MTSACGCNAPDPGDHDEETRPWWRDPAVLVPASSGVALAAGLATEWSGAAWPGAEWAGAGAVGQLLFWAALLLGGSTFAPGAIRGLVTHGRLGIGLLMTISAVGAVILGYVEEAAALAFLYSIAEALEDRAMDRARSGLRSLLRLVPDTATVRRGADTAEIPTAELRAGETLVVAPGERVATDGTVARGRSSVDTSAVTGESIPVEVEPGDAILAGSINTSGLLELTTTAPGTDNTLTTIVGLVERAQTEKGDRARLADRIARPLVPGVLVLAVLVAALGSLLGDPELWITRALIVLVAASPCALAISVPVTVVSAIGAASRLGVVITSGAAFERLGTIRHLAMDKTGTLTSNHPSVVRVLTALGVSESEVLGLAAAVERHSTHPLATAITSAAAESQQAGTPHVADVRESAGHGISGTVDGSRIAVGSPRRLASDELSGQITALEHDGMTVVVVHRDGRLIGAMGVRDELRAEVPVVVATLADHRIGVSMLTGDNPRTAAALGAQAGISDIRADLTPGGKAEAIAELSRSRPTAMIGDGINDAPALATADVGIAMGVRGSDAAIESADVAFTGTDLRLLPRALAHARRGGRIINQNIALSLILIATLVPLAMTGVLGLAAVVLIHELAEVLVILNGLRAARTSWPPVAAVGPAHEALTPQLAK
ncbi:heavy metal translocating P-type ATPase [Dietzia cinnamea]|uniref:heavy metal translocating P-type ATPase n=1 Tax=Dietzia cinnamea TaxID=321318 RepID=UPI0021A36A6E|nr:cation-translocating P-type ATPase [Dietzia cinnamea]MCT1639691.1 cadmium-translocating P-type ATPase [Dietzia cinnamea]